MVVLAVAEVTLNVVLHKSELSVKREKKIWSTHRTPVAGLV